MALAPTLLKFLNVSVGVGAVTLAGLTGTIEGGVRAPDKATLTVAGNAPTISVQLGPTTDPDVGNHTIVGQIPFLQRILVVAPGLPDSTPESNDLAPTLVWQETPTPTAGLAIIRGLAPAVVGDTGQSIGITSGLVVINGLAPTLDVPSGQSGTISPITGGVAFAGPDLTLTLTLLLELSTNVGTTDLVTITGLAPELFFQVGWTDVPVVLTPSWDDVPRV